MAHDGEILGIDRRRALLSVALALALGLGALALLAQATSLGSALDAFRRADHSWLAALLAGQLLAYAGYALGYRTIARACGGPCFTYWMTVRLSIVSFGAYVLASSAGGLGVDFWALHRAGEGVHRAGRRILAFNILEWAVLGALAAASGLLAFLVHGRSAPFGMALGWLVVVPSCVAGAVWISGRRRASRFSRLPRDRAPTVRGWLSRARMRWLVHQLRIGLADAVGALVFVRTLLARPGRYWGAPVGFALYWLGDLVTLYGALQALGESLGPFDLVLAYATGYVVTSSPLPAGAAGFAEAATAATLSAVGVPLGTAIFAVFLFRAFTFWLPIAPAVALVPHVRRLTEELERVEREPDAPCALEIS